MGLEQSDQEGAWREMRPAKSVGTRAGRAWGPLLGLLVFYPQSSQCRQRVLSRGMSRSDLGFEKLPLVALGRMNGRSR